MGQDLSGYRHAMPVAVNELILADPNAIAPGLRDLFLLSRRSGGVGLKIRQTKLGNVVLWTDSQHFAPRVVQIEQMFAFRIGDGNQVLAGGKELEQLCFVRFGLGLDCFLTGQAGTNCREEHVHGKRFGQVIIRPMLHPLTQYARSRIACHQDYRNGGSRRLGSQTFENAEPIDAGHINVAYDQVR